MSDARKRCTRCGEDRPRTDFGANRTRPDGLQPYCRPCSVAKDAKHYGASPTRRRDILARTQRVRIAHRARIADYLASHPCVDCGEADPIVLEFDHVRGEKRASLSVLKGEALSWETIEAEIAKCEVRCANCHRRRTHERRHQHPETIPQVPASIALNRHGGDGANKLSGVNDA